MIELKLIPDGAAEIPAEARDQEILADHFANATGIPDGSPAPIDDWRGVERVVTGSGRYLALRVPGEPTDYPGNSLDGIANAITNNISGLKPHPNGWEYVKEPTA